MSYFECRCPNCSLQTVFSDGRRQCYCINCGYLIRREEVEDGAEPVMSADGPEVPSPQQEGQVSIMVTIPDKQQPFTVSVDDEEVLRSSGGTYRLMVAPGKHRIRIRQNLFSMTQEADLDEGSRVTVSVSMMGIRMTVDDAGRQ